MLPPCYEVQAYEIHPFGSENSDGGTPQQNARDKELGLALTATVQG